MKKETIQQKTARLRAQRLERDAKAPAARDREYPVLGLDDCLPFGKHRGELVRDVVELDPNWLIWALENISTFEVSDEVMTELDIIKDPRRPVDRTR